MTIKAKSYAIGAGETPFAEPGTRFYLLAASTAMNIKLYRDTQIVGEADGFMGGLELGAFCEPFTRWSATPQSGIAGSVLVGVGDDPMEYNPLAGTLVFSDPLTGASAPPVGNATTSSQAGQAYVVNVTAPAEGAGQYSGVQFGGQNIANPIRGTVTGITITNSSAGALSFQIYLFTGGYSTIGVVGSNMQGGGPAAELAGGYGASTVGAGSQLKTVTVPANNSLAVSFAAPVVLPGGVHENLEIVCTTANTGFECTIEWTEG